MTIVLLSIIALVVVANLVIGIRVIMRYKGIDLKPLWDSFTNFEKDLEDFESYLREEFVRNREEVSRSAKETRTELSSSFHSLSDSVTNRMGQIAGMQGDQLESFSTNLSSLTKTNEDRFSRLIETVDSKLDTFHTTLNDNAGKNRNEISSALKSFQEQFKSSVDEFNTIQEKKFDTLTARQSEMLTTSERRLDTMRNVLEVKLKSIQDDNSQKLERMRQTVDERLQRTLDERLGESFKIVSDRLEQVHKGLGEMQTLANGVGDLKKVLSNVRNRGTLGEYQLEMLLEQILAPEQYAKAVSTKDGSRENVEFVVKLPAKDADGETILLPIDSKFPQNKFQALLDAYETADPESVDTALKELERTIKSLAKDIRDKYLNPPHTTDFALMFLPFEGLYAEVVKRPLLFETLQKEYKVNVVGPSTLAAFLHSLQVGFRTLAIQKRSSEVWNLLGAVKTEFGRFANILEGVQRNLNAASNKIGDATKKTRSMERRLKDVESLPVHETPKYLSDASNNSAVEAIDETVDSE